MSETTATDQATEPEDSVEPEAPEADETGEEHPDRRRDPGVDAAKYRRRAQQAEAERDALRSQLTALQGLAIDAALSQPVEIVPANGNRAIDPTTMQPRPVPVTLTHPGDLFAVGQVPRESLFGADGTPDPARIAAAVSELYAARPDLFTRAESGRVPTIGVTPDRDALTRRGFEGAFAPRH